MSLCGREKGPAKSGSRRPYGGGTAPAAHEADLHLPSGLPQANDHPKFFYATAGNRNWGRTLVAHRCVSLGWGVETHGNHVFDVFFSRLDIHQPSYRKDGKTFLQQVLILSNNQYSPRFNRAYHRNPSFKGYYIIITFNRPLSRETGTEMAFKGDSPVSQLSRNTSRL